MSELIISSDHHANWNSLEYWFQYAAKKNIPFIIPGDVVGDYNFEELAHQKNLSVPIFYVENEDTKKLQKLFFDIMKYHAKKLASLIDKYEVKTYFLHGNHEPINFAEKVTDYLINKDLFVDMNTHKGIIEVNGFKVAGISNTSQLMPYLHSIFSDEKLDELFIHQRAERKTIIGFDDQKVKREEDPLKDYDWIRIFGDGKQEIDIFFTHGQIGKGAWRKEKYASELPTLLSAAKASSLAKLTVDGHLHTTHKMRNDLGKPTIRAVGNKAFLIEKKDGQLYFEELESNYEYEAKKGITLSDLEEVKSPIDRLIES